MLRPDQRILVKAQLLAGQDPRAACQLMNDYREAAKTHDVVVFKTAESRLLLWITKAKRARAKCGLDCPADCALPECALRQGF
jgi:hypothetical protein